MFSKKTKKSVRYIVAITATLFGLVLCAEAQFRSANVVGVKVGVTQTRVGGLSDILVSEDYYSGYSFADHPEVVAYGRVLRPGERLRVETYLALRHDITLLNDYVSSDGRRVWDRTAHLAYSHNISGIAWDDSSALRKDTLASSALSMRSLRPVSDGDFVLVGDDDGPLSFEPFEPFESLKTSESLSDTVAVLGRRWLAEVSCEESNEKFEVDVRVDASQIRELLTPELAATFRLRVGGEEYAPDGDGVFRNVGLVKGGNAISLSASGPILGRTKDGGVMSGVRVFPNPTADGRVRIQVRLAEEVGLTVRLYDATGRLMGERRDGADVYHDVAVHLPSAGVYMVRLEADGETKTVSVVRK